MHIPKLCVTLQKNNKETARKIHELSPVQAQTGPAVRYDRNVIGKHLEMLADENTMHELYKSISESIHSLHKGQ